MGISDPSFHEAPPWTTPIRDLGLSLAGSALEPVLSEFQDELRSVGIVRVRPRFYLSTEWGVPDGTVAIAIPFYLARPDLTALHAEHHGHVEGTGHADILRYLRHEMGHVVNYAYRLFATEEWVELFGSMGQPYHEDYRPEPFSRRFVRHLPGWYAQKHPDEDWAETFAVWMTPGLDWHAEYADWPVALAKLQYCDRTMARLVDREPDVTDDELDEDVGELTYSLSDYYRDLTPGSEPFPPGLDSALRVVFDDGLGQGPGDLARKEAAELIRRLEPGLTRSLFHWTGFFPERSRPLLRHLAQRAEHLKLSYPEPREADLVAAFTTFLTTLALNHVNRGSFSV